MRNERRGAALMPLWTLAKLLAPIVLGLLVASGLLAGAPQVIYVTSESAGAVAVVDGSSLQLIRLIEVGHRPHNLEVTRGGLLLIATQGTEAVSIIDPWQERVTAQRIDIGASPHDLAVSEDGRTAFVVSGRGVLVRFDLGSGQLHRRVDLGGSPHNVIVLGQVAWITDVASRRLLVVDEESAPREVPISIVGHDLAWRAGNKEIWVTPWQGNHMVIVDAETRREVAQLPVGRHPSHKHIAFTENGGEAWVTEPSSGRVFVVDALKRRAVDEINLGGHPHHLRLAAGRVYVAVGPDELVVLDARSRSILQRVKVGSGVHDVALDHSTR